MAEQRRGRRGLATIGSVAATLLVLSGFGAMVVEARPGGTLYGLHAMFFDERRAIRIRSMLSAKADLAKVQQLIDQGQWTKAAEPAGRGQQHRAVDRTTGRPQRLDGRNESAEHEGRVAQSECDAAAGRRRRQARSRCHRLRRPPVSTPPSAASPTAPSPRTTSLAPQPIPESLLARQHHHGQPPASGGAASSTSWRSVAPVKSVGV